MADTLDVISLTAAKTAVNLTNTAHDAELARQITAVSRILDDVCGPVVQRTVTGELHDGGRSFVQLRRSPVTSITTVTEAEGGTTTALSVVAFGGVGNGYSAPTLEGNPSLLSGMLVRRRYGNPAGWGPVQVTYVAGRYANTAAVDARFVEAAASILRRMWKRESGAWAQSSTVFETVDATPGSGFFRAVKPIVEELLFDEVRTHLVGFA